MHERVTECNKQLVLFERALLGTVQTGTKARFRGARAQLHLCLVGAVLECGLSPSGTALGQGSVYTSHSVRCLLWGGLAELVSSTSKWPM